MKCGIYKITNKINGHAYIGQSIDITTRWNHHKNFNSSMSHYPLYQAFKKYGIDNFLFEIIEECSKEQLDEKEIYYIEYYNSYRDGYNQTTGGQEGNSNNCIKISKEDIEIIYDLLINNLGITQRQIAEMFNVGEDTISDINQGKARVKVGYEYPLRINKHKYICQRCGKILTGEATYCLECRSFLNRVVERPSREELKNLIRHTAFTTIGKQFGVSDNTIRKWCDSYSLPRKASEIKQYTNEEWANI